ncbi:MAG: hypothetical protein OJJ54_01455 [Pseudonocardia sp.]|nr:hypothetical protein [Pseudonocardia sp.]
MRGPLAHGVLGVIRTRFDHVSAPGEDASVLIVDGVDEASVRALLTLLWDTGHELLSMTSSRPPPEEGRP